MGMYEWWDVCRILKPGITWEEFEVKWTEFQALKAQHQAMNA